MRPRTTVRPKDDGKVARLLPGVGPVAVALDEVDVPLEEPRPGRVGSVDLRECGLQVAARLVAQRLVTRLAEVLERLVGPGPPVAVLVVLAGRRPRYRLATGDAGHGGVVPRGLHAGRVRPTAT